MGLAFWIAVGVVPSAIFGVCVIELLQALGEARLRRPSCSGSSAARSWSSAIATLVRALSSRA